MTSGERPSANAAAGQSTNCEKLNRKTALTWYSVGAAAPARGWARRSERQQRRDNEGRVAQLQNCHATFPYTLRSISPRAAGVPNST